jgi:hypothetical protein
VLSILLSSRKSFSLRSSSIAQALLVPSVLFGGSACFAGSFSFAFVACCELLVTALHARCA